MKEINRGLKAWKKAQNSENNFYRKIDERKDFQTYKRILHKLWKAFLVSFDDFENKNVLEVGCGCHGMIHFIDKHCHKIGIDPLCSAYRDIYFRHRFHVSHVTGIVRIYRLEMKSMILSYLSIL